MLIAICFSCAHSERATNICIYFHKMQDICSKNIRTAIHYIYMILFQSTKGPHSPFLSYQSHHVKELVFSRLLAGPGKGPFLYINGYSRSWMQRTSKDSRSLPLLRNLPVLSPPIIKWDPPWPLVPLNASPHHMYILPLILVRPY